MHIVVLILGQSSIKTEVLQLVSIGLVSGIALVVLRIIHRIIGLHPGLPFLRIFLCDDGLGLCSKLEVLVFYDTGVRIIGIRVVHRDISLKAFLIQQFFLKP